MLFTDLSPDTQELRLYSFVNFYLSSIQQGIQTGHAAVRMVRKFGDSTLPNQTVSWAKRSQMVTEWADNYETFITLNGGNNDGILEAARLTGELYEHFPHALFNEDKNSLNGLLTTVAIILPESIFNAKLSLDTLGRKSYVFRKELTKTDGQSLLFEQEYDQDHIYFPFIDYLKSCSLAR